MGVVIFRGVSFAFGGGAALLQDVSFRLDGGIFGVVGENGAGKTTLLRLAAGELLPDQGAVAVGPRGSVVSVCRQTADELDPEVSSFAEDLSGEALAARDLMQLDDADLERWSSLSYGERRRWQLTAAIASRPDVLFVDEPTNHLDAEAREGIVRALRSFRGTALVVSHDRALLDAICTGTLRVHNGRVDVYTLPFSMARAEWEREAKERSLLRAALVRERDRCAERLSEARDRRARAEKMRSRGARMKDKNDSDARGVGADLRVARAERHLGKLTSARRTELSRAEQNIPEFEGGRAVGRSVHVGYEPAPRARTLSLCAAELCAGERRILSGVAVSVGRASRVHVVGPNGAGKSTLIRALAAASSLPPDKLFYLPQDLNAGGAAALLGEVVRAKPEERSRTLSLVAALGVDPEKLLVSKAPSPGEARKLSIALALTRKVWALLLDEPTNHLDLPSIERIEAALSEYPGALVMASHDEHFARKLTSERWVLSGGRIFAESAANIHGAQSRGGASIGGCL